MHFIPDTTDEAQYTSYHETGGDSKEQRRVEAKWGGQEVCQVIFTELTWGMNEVWIRPR